MKNILLLCILLLSIIGYAQPNTKESYIGLTAGFDARNALFGSEATRNKPALDGIIGISLVGCSTVVNMNYESFKKIGFEKWSTGIGYKFPLYGWAFGDIRKTDFIPSVNLDMISRDIEHQKFSVFGASIDLTLQWMLSDQFGVQATANVAQRPDIQLLYNQNYLVKSGYIKLIYKIKSY